MVKSQLQSGATSCHRRAELLAILKVGFTDPLHFSITKSMMSRSKNREVNHSHSEKCLPQSFGKMPFNQKCLKFVLLASTWCSAMRDAGMQPR